MSQNKEVNLLKQIKVDDRWAFFPAAFAKNGHIRPQIVHVKGNDEHHPEGNYYLEYRRDGKRLREAVGQDAEEAHNRQEAKRIELAAQNAGMPILARTSNGNRVLLTAAIAEFLEETKLTKKPKTLSAYRTALHYFQESCHKLYVQDIERKDLLKFIAFLRDEKGQSARSVYNKFEVTMTFLKAQKVRDLIGKNDWPRFVEEEPEIYEREELERFFAACDDKERVWFEFFLMTGMREQEVMNTYWSDIHFNHAVVRMTHKPDRGWTPKAYKEREIPIPDKLVQRLKAWKAKSDKTCGLVFPTAGCNPKLDFLDCCKAVAKRAGYKNLEDFYLHKFRATFCTWHLWAGVDLRTCQHWMGHTDIESTMRYLKPNRSQEVKAKVNHTFST